MDVKSISDELEYYSQLKNIEIDDIARVCGIKMKNFNDISISDYLKLCTAIDVPPYMPFLAMEKNRSKTENS